MLEAAEGQLIPSDYFAKSAMQLIVKIAQGSLEINAECMLETQSVMER